MHEPLKTGHHLWKNAHGRWYLVWREDGKPKRVSLKTKSRIEAEKIKRRMLASIDPDEQGALTVWDAGDMWVQYKARPMHGLTKDCVNLYARLVRRMKEFWGPTDGLEEVTTNAVDNFLAFLEERYKLSRSGLKKRLSLLRSLFKFHHERGNMTRNPAAPINFRGVKSERHPAMTEEEYAQLHADLTAWADQVEDSARMKPETTLAQKRAVVAWVETLWFSGLRSVEAVRLEWEDIDLERRIWTLHSPMNKGGDRVLPMHQRVVDLMGERKESGLARPLFSIDIMRRRWKAFKSLHPQWAGTNLHSLRHAFVTRIVLNGHPWAAQMLASHHSTEMTQLYTHACSV